MAHTDNTQPRRLRDPLRGYAREWTQAGEIRFRARTYNRQARLRARADLRRGATPEPVQPRHRALWDAW